MKEWYIKLIFSDMQEYNLTVSLRSSREEICEALSSGCFITMNGVGVNTEDLRMFEVRDERPFG